IAVDMAISGDSELPAGDARTQAPGPADAEPTKVRELARPTSGSKPEPVRKADAPPTIASASPAKAEGTPLSQNEIPPAAVFEIAEQTQEVDSQNSLPVMPGAQQVEADAIRPGAGSDRRDGQQ